MFKKVLVMMLALVAVPTFALASWTITASKTPAAAVGYSAPSADPVSISAIDDATTSVDFTIPSATGTGYTLTSVTIDGTRVLDPVNPKVLVNGVWNGNWNYKVAGTFTVTRSVNGQLLNNHTIVANYTADASKTFAIKSIATPGGWISKSQTVANNDTAMFSVAANPNHTLVGVYLNPTSIDPVTGQPVGGSPIAPTLANGVTTYNVVGNANKTIAAKYTANETLAAILNIPATLSASAGSKLTLIANTKPGYTGANGSPAVSYSWGAACGPATAYDTATPPVAIPDGANSTRVITVPAIGSSCIVSVTATVAGKGSATTTATITGAQIPVQDCTSCHNGTGGPDKTAFTGSAHDVAGKTCNDCHNPTGTLSHAYKTVSTITCSECHGPYVTPASLTAKCAECHNSTDVHTVKIQNMFVGTKPATCNHCHTVPANAHAGVNTQSCIACHDVAAPKHGNGVNDNNGVRAITTEFAKWSHHVTGVTLQDAHCAACHLEGKVVGGAIVVDKTYHMADAKTHLRNADDDSDFAWDPANPNHSNMDNFCMSCHDANGATSAQSLLIQVVAGAPAGNPNNPLNPFNDTISNQYDKMMRGRVVNVDNQFDIGNASHHAVKGQKYSGRDRAAGQLRSISSPSTFKGYSGMATFNNTSSTLGEFAGERQTIYEAGRFVSTYQTLSAVPTDPSDKTLGDDSVLHCGDCHTVGQWKAGSASTLLGGTTTVVIGAHGSENEYMLRNSKGTDELHRGAQYNYSPANMLGGNTSGGINLGRADGAPAVTPGVSTNFAGVAFTQVIGGAAPGTSVNIANQAVPATEVPESQPFLVCYNCHVYTEYASVYFSNTAQGGREGSHAYGDHTRGNYCNGPYNTSGSGRATNYTAVYGKQVSDVKTLTTAFDGVTANFNMGRLQPGTAASYLLGETADTAAVWCSATVLNSLELKTQGTGNAVVYNLTTGAVAVANSACNDPTGATGVLSTNATTKLAAKGMNGSGNGAGNLFQIQCANCHNSGPNNGFGGIHGSKIDTYVSADGQTNKPRRFLPGLGNVKWVPGAQFGTDAQRWEQEANNSLLAKSRGGSYQAGCYTLGASGPGLNHALPTGETTTKVEGSAGNSGQLAGTWGACNDHTGVDGLERTIVRPVTY